MKRKNIEKALEKGLEGLEEGQAREIKEKILSDLDQVEADEIIKELENKESLDQEESGKLKQAKAKTLAQEMGYSKRGEK